MDPTPPAATVVRTSAGPEIDGCESTRIAPKPNLADVAVLDDPDGEIDDRRSDRPDADLADVATNEADGAEQCEHESKPAEDELPHPDQVQAEESLRERPGRDRDHRDLEHRPAEALEHVEARREVRAALAERRAVQRHRRHARLGSDQRGGAEHRVADQPADDCREQRLLQRQPEIARGDEHEQRDAQVGPEE